MFLQRLTDRNAGLIDTAIRMHRDEVIGPNTFVFDLDAIYQNGQLLAQGAHRYGFRTFAMAKQFANNPFIVQAALNAGIDTTVAVDIQGAKQLHRYGLPVGHLGHLNQIPACDTRAALEMEPEQITVYSVEAAQRLSEVAGSLGRTQRLLMRPYGPDDVFFTGQEGGFLIDGFRRAARVVDGLEHVSVAGVTAFPCISYNPASTDPVEATPNFSTIKHAAAELQEEGIVDTPVINAPGNTASDTYPLLADMGATQVEPGHGLLGTTPNQAFRENVAERPSYVYVSEVSHHFKDRAYAFGGGLFMDIYDPSFEYKALVGKNFDAAVTNCVRYLRKELIIDYHAELMPGERCAVGDTVIFGFRTQAQMTRGYLAVVAGISTGAPQLMGTFDTRCTMLDSNYNPVPTPEVRARLRELEDLYPVVQERED